MTGNESGSHRRWAERSIDHKVTKGVRIPKHMTASWLWHTATVSRHGRTGAGSRL